MEESSPTVFILDVKTYTWTRLTPQGSFPKYNDSHAAVLVDDCVVSIGGRGAVKFHNCVFALDLLMLEWRRVGLLGSDLDACFGHSADFMKQERCIIVHLEAKPFNKTFLISVEGWQNKLVRTKGNAPTTRQHHSSCVANMNLYIFGGSTDGIVFADLFLLSLRPGCRSGMWSQVKSGASMHEPPPSRNASMLRLSGKLVVFGGVSAAVESKAYAFDMMKHNWVPQPFIMSNEASLPSTEVIKFHEAVLPNPGNALVIAGIGSSVYEIRL